MSRNTRSIYLYLLITFGITWAVELIVILCGFRVGSMTQGYFWMQLVLAGVMWIPALSAFVVMRFYLRVPFDGLNIRFGNPKPYILAGCVIPVIFILVYGISWWAGLANPDWNIRGFTAMLQDADPGGDYSVDSPGLVIALIFLVTVFVSPVLNAFFGLGEEIGWRGFLLPRLMPLGKFGAYLLLGVIWMLWHLPLLLVGFFIPGNIPAAIFLMLGLTLTLGVVINEFALYYRSSILAGFIHGVFNSQAYGIWRIVFIGTDPVWGGFTGAVSMIVWMLLGFFSILYFTRLKRQQNGIKY